MDFVFPLSEVLIYYPTLPTWKWPHRGVWASDGWGLCLKPKCNPREKTKVTRREGDMEIKTLPVRGI